MVKLKHLIKNFSKYLTIFFRCKDLNHKVQPHKFDKKNVNVTQFSTIESFRNHIKKNDFFNRLYNLSIKSPRFKKYYNEKIIEELSRFLQLNKIAYKRRNNLTISLSKEIKIFHDSYVRKYKSLKSRCKNNAVKFEEAMRKVMVANNFI